MKLKTRNHHKRLN